MERSVCLPRTQWIFKVHPSEGIGEAVHINPKKVKNKETYLSAYWVEGKIKDLNSDNMNAALKFATTTLNYPSSKGIPIYRLDTHSLRSVGANALSLAGYRNRDIQKMGRWREETFKDYIREELYYFLEGMLTAMKQYFKFVNITEGAYSELVDVTRTTVVSDYQPATA